MQVKALLERAWPYRGRLALTVLLSLLGALASLVIPWFAAQVLGGVIETRSTGLGMVLPLLVLALTLLAGLSIANALVSSAVSAEILADFRAEVYAHLQSLPLAFHDQSRKGDLLSLMSWDISRLSSFVSHWLASAVSAIFTVVGALIVLFWLDPLLALLLPALVPTFFIVQKLVGRRLRSISAEVRAAEAQVMADAEESLEMLPAIKAFARERLEQTNYTRDVAIARHLSVRQARILAYLGPTNQLLMALAVIAILLLVQRGGASESMNATQLFGFLLYAALLTRPIGTLANLYGELNGARGSLERLQHVLEERPEPGYHASTRLQSCRGEISFSDVWFAYPGRDEILRGASLDVRAGEIVALTGENGAGKTTLIRLLLRFYLPQRGTIRLDGNDTARIDIQDLRRQIGYVPQRALLFNGSVRDNIGWGLEDASESELNRAASLAQALEFIKGLPFGFDTEIGDHGVRLSGGQRQRIALARALLKDPPILILDEATSMYDLDGEAAFVEACKTALVGRTVLLITHRPASLALADRIVEFAGGRLVRTLEPSPAVEGETR